MKTLIINAHPDPHAAEAATNRMVQHLVARLPAGSTEIVNLAEADIQPLDKDMLDAIVHTVFQRQQLVGDADYDGEDQRVKHRGCGDLRLPQGAGARRPHPGVQATEGDSGQGPGGEDHGSAANAAAGQQIAPGAVGRPEPEGQPTEVKDRKHGGPRPLDKRQSGSQCRSAEQQGDGGEGDAFGDGWLPGLEGVGVGCGGP